MPVAAETVWIPHGPGGPLDDQERARAAGLAIWVVWWELPDKFREALCVNPVDAEQLLAELTHNHFTSDLGQGRPG